MKIYFKEEQKYRQAWLWFIIVPLVAGSILFFLSGFNQQIFHGEDFGNKPMSNIGLITVSIFSILIMILVAALFYFTRMIVTISSESIHLLYPPLLRKEIIFKSDEILKYEVRTYNPILEYGGWGVKTGNKKNGKAYNVRGNIGLQLILTNGSKVMIGTQRKEAISAAMRKFMETENAK